jgi:hypothetical protein
MPNPTFNPRPATAGVNSNVRHHSQCPSRRPAAQLPVNVRAQPLGRDTHARPLPLHRGTRYGGARSVHQGQHAQPRRTEPRHLALGCAGRRTEVRTRMSSCSPSESSLGCPWFPLPAPPKAEKPKPTRCLTHSSAKATPRIRSRRGRTLPIFGGPCALGSYGVRQVTVHSPGKRRPGDA